MQIRPATVSDAGALAVVHVRSWQAAYRGQMPQRYLDELDPAGRSKIWEERLREDLHPGARLVLEHETEGVIGFAIVSESRDPDADPQVVGEVMAIYLLPGHWGRGGGALLMSAGLRRLAEAGFRAATLWVLATNQQARRFYEAVGWRADGAVKTDDSRGFPLHEVRYRRDSLTT